MAATLRSSPLCHAAGLALVILAATAGQSATGQAQTSQQDAKPAAQVDGTGAQPSAAPASQPTTGPADAGSGAAQGPADQCAALVARGQLAAAIARGCPQAGQLPWAGSAVVFGQSFAPFFATQPDSDNPYYALQLTLLPRVMLGERVSLRAAWSLAYEVTQPDLQDNSGRAVGSDLPLLAMVDLGRAAGFGFQAGPRLELPTSRRSRAGGAILGLGLSAMVARVIQQLGDMQLAARARYQYNAANQVTRQPERGTGEAFEVPGVILYDEGEGGHPATVAGAPLCESGSDASIPCSAGSLATTVNALRFNLSAAWPLSDHWNLQTGYTLLLNQPRKLPTGPIPAITAQPEQLAAAERSWRRIGQYNLAAAYQPTSQLAISLGLQTTVCYYETASVQSVLGGCAAALSASGGFDDNPLLNRNSLLNLSFSWFPDQTYLKLSGGSVNPNDD